MGRKRKQKTTRKSGYPVVDVCSRCAQRPDDAGLTRVLHRYCFDCANVVLIEMEIRERERYCNEIERNLFVMGRR